MYRNSKTSSKTISSICSLNFIKVFTLQMRLALLPDAETETIENISVNFIQLYIFAATPGVKCTVVTLIMIITLEG